MFGNLVMYFIWIDSAFLTVLCPVLMGYRLTAKSYVSRGLLFDQVLGFVVLKGEQLLEAVEMI